MEKKYQIQLTVYAKDDIEEIYDYIQNYSIYYAGKTKKEIENRIADLAYMLYMGRKLHNFNNYFLRELIYKSYRIIYSVNSNKIYIRRILRSARFLSPKLIKNI